METWSLCASTYTAAAQQLTGSVSALGERAVEAVRRTEHDAAAVLAALATLNKQTKSAAGRASKAQTKAMDDLANHAKTNALHLSSIAQLVARGGTGFEPMLQLLEDVFVPAGYIALADFDMNAVPRTTVLYNGLLPDRAASHVTAPALFHPHGAPNVLQWLVRDASGADCEWITSLDVCLRVFRDGALLHWSLTDVHICYGDCRLEFLLHDEACAHVTLRFELTVCGVLLFAEDVLSSTRRHQPRKRRLEALTTPPALRTSFPLDSLKTATWCVPTSFPRIPLQRLAHCWQILESVLQWYSIPYVAYGGDTTAALESAVYLLDGAHTEFTFELFYSRADDGTFDITMDKRYGPRRLLQSSLFLAIREALKQDTLEAAWAVCPPVLDTGKLASVATTMRTGGAPPDARRFWALAPKLQDARISSELVPVLLQLTCDPDVYQRLALDDSGALRVLLDALETTLRADDVPLYTLIKVIQLLVRLGRAVNLDAATAWMPQLERDCAMCFTGLP